MPVGIVGDGEGGGHSEKNGQDDRDDCPHKHYVATKFSKYNRVRVS